MAKVLNIQDDPHYADYAELSTPPLPDYKAANRKTTSDYIVDGFWILVALFAVYCVSRVQS